MSLWSDLEAMASRCKHSDGTVDAEDVRRLCRQAQSAVELLDQFRHSQEWLAFTTSQGGRLRITINTDDPVQFMADLAAACDGADDD